VKAHRFLFGDLLADLAISPLFSDKSIGDSAGSPARATAILAKGTAAAEIANQQVFNHQSPIYG
jgi:hypothetical protein